MDRTNYFNKNRIVYISYAYTEQMFKCKNNYKIKESVVQQVAQQTQMPQYNRLHHPIKDKDVHLYSHV